MIPRRPSSGVVRSMIIYYIFGRVEINYMIYTIGSTSCLTVWVSLSGGGDTKTNGEVVLPVLFFLHLARLGPFMTNFNVQRERPRNESPRWVKAVSNVANDITKVNLTNRVVSMRGSAACPIVGQQTLSNLPFDEFHGLTATSDPLFR